MVLGIKDEGMLLLCYLFQNKE